MYIDAFIYVQSGIRMGIHITDKQTVDRVRLLAKVLSKNITETVNLAVSHELARNGVSEPTATTAPKRTRAGLEADLEAIIRSTTLDYTRLVAREHGKKGVGSRIYQMLGRHGPLGTLERLVVRPTEGLRFLAEKNRLDLAAETIALDPRFERIVSDDVRERARTNLATFGA
jgi:hypothetical protein